MMLTNMHNTVTVTATVNSSGWRFGDYVGHLTSPTVVAPGPSVARLSATSSAARCVQTAEYAFCRPMQYNDDIHHEERRCVHLGHVQRRASEYSVPWLSSLRILPVQGTLIPAGGTVTVTRISAVARQAGEFADIRFRPVAMAGVTNIDVIPSAPADSRAVRIMPSMSIPSSRYFIRCKLGPTGQRFGRAWVQI